MLQSFSFFITICNNCYRIRSLYRKLTLCNFEGSIYKQFVECRIQYNAVRAVATVGHEKKLGHPRHRAAFGLARAVAPPLFSKIVLKAFTSMAFSTEISSETRT